MLCDFHLEQAWERWLNTSLNNRRNVKEVVLSLLRNVAAAETEEEFQIASQVLHENPLWKPESSAKFRNYLNNTWLPEKKVF